MTGIITDEYSYFSDSQVELIKIASTYSDNYFPASNSENKTLHAYQNYVVVLEYIYSISIKVKNGYTVYTAIENTEFKGESLTTTQEDAIKEAIIEICSNPINGENNYYIKDGGYKNQAIKILGTCFTFSWRYICT
jgi:Leu/Phe-tRNA-protein transferase